MIASKAKSHANFSNLINYQLRLDKCEEFTTNNLFADDRRGIADEMNMTFRAANKGRPDHEKIKSPTYHISISWADEDNPTNEQMLAVGEDFIEHMDLEEYQSVIAVHNDTDHKHIHVVANRVHPTGGELWEEWKWRDTPEGRECIATHHQRVEKFERMMEKEFGWRVEPGRHFGEWEKEFDGYAPTLSEIKRAEKVERVAGGMGMDNLDLRPVKVRAQELKEELYQAQSFKELDKVLNKNGLWIAAKGQGAVFTDEVYSVKASKVSRGLTGPKLEQRFGEDLKDYVQRREKQVDITQGKEHLKQWGHWYNQTIHERILSESTNRIAVAKGELKEIQQYSQRITTTQEELKDHFLGAYENSREAYGLVGKYIEIHGYDAADTQLRTNPEQFGEISDTGRIPDLRASIRDMEGVQNRFSQHIQSMSGPERKKETEELRSAIEVWEKVRGEINESGNNQRASGETTTKEHEKYKSIKWLHWPKGEQPVFAFGKMEGKDIDHVIQEEPGYIEWMKTQEFPQEVIQILEDRKSGKPLADIRSDNKDYLKRIEKEGKSMDLSEIDQGYSEGSSHKKSKQHLGLSNKVRSKIRENEGGKVVDQSTTTLIAVNRAIQEGLKTGSPHMAPFKAGVEAWKQATGVVAANAKNISGGKVAVTFLKGGLKTAQHAAHLISNPSGGSVKIMKSILQSATRKIGNISREAGRGR